MEVILVGGASIPRPPEPQLPSIYADLLAGGSREMEVRKIMIVPGLLVAEAPRRGLLLEIQGAVLVAKRTGDAGTLECHRQVGLAGTLAVTDVFDAAHDLGMKVQRLRQSRGAGAWDAHHDKVRRHARLRRSSILAWAQKKSRGFNSRVPRHVRRHHLLDQLDERRLGRPAKFAPRLAGIAEQELHLSRAVEFRVDLHQDLSGLGIESLFRLALALPHHG